MTFPVKTSLSSTSSNVQGVVQFSCTRASQGPGVGEVTLTVQCACTCAWICGCACVRDKGRRVHSASNRDSSLISLFLRNERKVERIIFEVSREILLQFRKFSLLNVRT